jgi:Flp pilus assembly protein TadG
MRSLLRHRRDIADRHTPRARRTGLLRNVAPGRGKADGGYVLIMTALLLLPLIAFTGFAVDVGSWYAQGVRMQRAADAASLAGVVWAAGAPGACPSQTYNCVAIATAAKDGYTITNANVTKISDSKIMVTISAKADIFFAGPFVGH